MSLFDENIIDRGTHYDMTPPAAFMMLAIYAYSPDEAPAAPGLVERVEVILGLAAAKGFDRGQEFKDAAKVYADSGPTLIKIATEITAYVGGNEKMIDLLRGKL